MTGAAWVLLTVAGLFAAGNWVAVSRQSKPLEYVCKPGTLVALVGVALALDPVVGDRRSWFVIALALSLVGDVFLMLPSDRFVAGLCAFLLGHLAYAVGFNQSGGSFVALGGALAGTVVVSVIVGTPMLSAARRRHRELTVPVVAYMAVITVMVATAMATGNALASVGAVLFYSSDALIGWTRFVRPLRWAPVAIIAAYHLGQAGLTVSLTQAR